jgi:lipopolysaccharide transport system permease protein
MQLMNPITPPVSLLYRHRRVLLWTTWNDVRTRFAGSVLGLSWLVLYPLLLLATYAAVYICIFQIQLPQFTGAEYVAYIFCGLIPFLGFSESLGTGVSSVVSHAHLVKNTLFPIDLIPPKAVLISQTTQLAGMVLLLIALAFLNRLTPWALLIVPLWGCQVAFTIGVIWILSGLNVYFRDLQTMIGIIIMILMMISPIAYTEEMIPARLRPILAFNPMQPFIVSYQKCLMLGQCPSRTHLIAIVALATISLSMGYLFFSRLKTLFVDNI